jgi:hypothetical protein
MPALLLDHWVIPHHSLPFAPSKRTHAPPARWSSVALVAHEQRTQWNGMQTPNTPGAGGGLQTLQSPELAQSMSLVQ